jgi:L-fuculose-phosphate aldolase
MTTPSSIEDLRRTVATACHVLEANGQNDMVWGHVSARDPEGRGIWMKAQGLGFGEIQPEDVLLVSFDGEVLVGERRRHIEYPIHTEIMRARPDVNCVIHTHSQSANAFSSTDQLLRPLSHDACYFVPPAIHRFTQTGDLIRTRELGQDLAAALGDRNAILIPNHGMVLADVSVARAVMGAVLLDRACHVQLMAGEVKGWSSDDEAIAKRSIVWSDSGVELGWQYLVRQVNGKGGD